MNAALPDTGFKAEINARIRNDHVIETRALFFDVKVKNSSRNIWPSRGSNPVRLAYHWLNQDGSAMVFDGERTLLPYDLGPETEVLLKSSVRVPDFPGSYVLEFDMVQEFVSWFKDKGSSTFRIGVSIAAELPKFSDYQGVWDNVDLSKDHWSIVGPGSEQQFNELGEKKLQLLLDLGLTPESAVLDVGCGTGCLTRAMADFLNSRGCYVGTDIAKQAVDFCESRFRQPNFDFLQNTMTAIPVQDGQFDFIVFFSVFTHTFPNETVALLRDARRLLRKSGLILADVFLSTRDVVPRNDRALVPVVRDDFINLLQTVSLIGCPVQESIWKFGNEIFQRVMFEIRTAVTNEAAECR
jgi:SAM-dependent methyltransferase